MACLTELIPREAGYIAKLVSAFVSAGPTEMYNYVSEHANEVIASLARNMNHLGTCDIVRFRLDIPLISTYISTESIVDGKPWWNENAVLIDPFITCLNKPEMAGYVYLLLVSIIQRATVYV